MRRFRVYARSEEYSYVDLLAPTSDEAIAMAESIDGAHFRPAPRWDNWQIDSADPVAEDEPFEPLDERYYNTL